MFGNDGRPLRSSCEVRSDRMIEVPVVTALKPVRHMRTAESGRLALTQSPGFPDAFRTHAAIRQLIVRCARPRTTCQRGFENAWRYITVEVRAVLDLTWALSAAVTLCGVAVPPGSPEFGLASLNDQTPRPIPGAQRMWVSMRSNTTFAP